MQVDQLLERAQTRTVGDPNEPILIRRRSLVLLLDEIEHLRTAIVDALPDDDRPGAHHSSADDTERRAAYAVFPKTGIQRYRVLQAIVYSDGLTDAEVAAATGIYLYSAAPRRNELYLGGWVRDSGKRRLTGNGGEGIVWQATERAYVALQQRTTS